MEQASTQNAKQTAGGCGSDACALAAQKPARAPARTLSRKQKVMLGRIGAAAAIYVLAWLPLGEYAWVGTAASLVAYAVVGYDVLWRALRNILRGQVFDENFLMAVATVGALVLGDYREAVAVLLFYQVGEWFQSYAVGRSRRSIAALMDIRPDYANLQQPDGSLQRVNPEQVAVGDVVVVRPGERVPLDGAVLAGTSSLDTSALTGESAPRDVAKGDEVISGCINQSGTLTVQVAKVYGESTVAKILDLVENAGSKKAHIENFITKFARYYTPAVCFAALALALVPPLATQSAFGPWVYRALTFLVISCPCALVISIPLSFFGGLGGASKKGVLIKGSNYLEALAAADTVVMDKTGTLTHGQFAVSAVLPASGYTEASLLELAALAEYHSGHPIAQSIKAAYGGPAQPERVGDVQELAGFGVRAVVDGKPVLAGNAALLQKEDIAFEVDEAPGTAVYFAENGRFAGSIRAEDQIKPDAKQAIDELRALGVSKTVMLTGDNDAVGRQVAGQLGVDEAYTQLLPAGKVEKVESLLEGRQGKGKLVFVGDGINDAPVLARADVGVAMGGLGSDAAIEAADVVIMTDEPSKLPEAIRISRKTRRIAAQNVVFALGVKGIVLLLGALGFASMWAAVFADVGVSVIAILNAMRALQG